jgi:FkbM family methyltransferase
MATVTERRAVREILAEKAEGGFVPVVLNEQELWLPTETLNTVIHCVYEEDGVLRAWVETSHFNWMRDRLRPGMHFIDVGAATGTILLPILKQFGSSISAIAFEPRAVARDLLMSAIRRNGLSKVDVVAMACADAPGRATFHELPDDDAIPYLSECSTLAPYDHPGVRDTQVDVTTLDRQFGFFARLRMAGAVVKIDVEGYETKVLEGAMKFLDRVRPSLAIDIHYNPSGDGKTTEADVRNLLTPLGYSFENMQHVLLCTP